MKHEWPLIERTLVPLATLLLLAAMGCVSVLEEGLREGGEGIMVVFSQDDGAEGAERIRIAPEGDIYWERWRPSFVDHQATSEEGESHFDREADVSLRGTLNANEREHLREVLLEIEAWDAQSPESFGPIDTPPLSGRRTTLRLEGRGDVAESWQWSRDVDTDPRLSRLRSVLQRFVAALADTGGRD